MVATISLWWPVLLSAILVYLVSTIIHMATPLHRGDWRRLPKEDEVMAALRPFDIPPGDYGMPLASSMAAMKDPAHKAKLQAGPVGFFTIFPTGLPAIGKSLILWFLYGLVVSAYTAYVCSHALAWGAGYRAVFRIAGCTSFAAYSLALLQHSIWYRRNWGTTLRSMFDGLIYGLLTAATFAWLWPH
jgi:hypothetical protein